jgi:hypothetical protein
VQDDRPSTQTTDEDRKVRDQILYREGKQAGLRRALFVARGLASADGGWISSRLLVEQIEKDLANV